MTDPFHAGQTSVWGRLDRSDVQFRRPGSRSGNKRQTTSSAWMTQQREAKGKQSGTRAGTNAYRNDLVAQNPRREPGQEPGSCFRKPRRKAQPPSREANHDCSPRRTLTAIAQGTASRHEPGGSATIPPGSTVSRCCLWSPLINFDAGPNAGPIETKVTNQGSLSAANS